MDRAARTKPRREPPNDFADAVLHGLRQPEKAIPCRFFYDERGSDLFEEITRLPEYYPARTEIALLQAHAAEIAALAGPRCCLVEFGSGSSRKTDTLIAALDAPVAYVPIDICQEALDGARTRLQAAFPGLPVAPVCADFNTGIVLPKWLRPARKLGFFPGSTIGNFHPGEAAAFLRRAASLLGKTGALLIGADLEKDDGILIPAYNDAAGVTAAFNLNLLTRINRELGGTFDIAAFAHEAVYNCAAGRIEMYLRSITAQTVTVMGEAFDFGMGERIHTENSYKYTPESFAALAVTAGWDVTKSWMDADRLFSVHYLTPREAECR